MTLGNKTQATALGVVALFAMVFLGQSLFSTLGGASSAPVLSALGLKSESVAESDATGVLPNIVARDAFAHPALEAKAEALLGPSSTGKEPGGQPKVSPLPVMAGQVQTEPVEPVVEPKPEENTGGSQKEEGAERVAIKLVALVRAGEPAAFVAVKGGRSQSVAVGDEVMEGIRVKKIGDGYVDLLANGKTTRLVLGQEVSL